MDPKTVYVFRTYYGCNPVLRRVEVDRSSDSGDALTRLELWRSDRIKLGFEWFEIDPYPVEAFEVIC